MITRAILLLLAMMTGLSAAEAADRSRLVSTSQGVRSAVTQLLKTAQSERVGRRARTPLAFAASKFHRLDTRSHPVDIDYAVIPHICIFIADRPLT